MAALVKRLYLSQGEEGERRVRGQGWCVGIEQVRPWAETRVQLDNAGLAQRVDGWIGGDRAKRWRR